ncbi:hypothetical protein ACFL09_06990, partial [Planctomycetota bacterium]
MLAFLLGGAIAHGILSSLPAPASSHPAAVASLRLSEWLVEANPFVRVSQIMQTGFSDPPIGFQVLSNLGLGLACFLLSWALFGLTTREHRTAAPARGILLPRTSRIPLLKVERPWRNAVAWKEFHFLTGGRALFIGRFLLLGAVTAALPVGLACFLLSWALFGLTTRE